MFLMNFLFDFANLTGVFSGDRTVPPGGGPGRGPLFTSANWLKLNPAPPPGTPEPNPLTAAFNPELPTIWTDLLDMDSGTVVIQSAPAGITDEGNVGVRIGLDPDSPATAGLAAAPPALTIAVCFGRPVAARQKRSSPFFSNPGVPPANQIVQTTFVQTFAAPSGVDALGNPFWFFPIALIRHRPDAIPPAGSRQHRTHRYEFSVGVTAVSGGVTHHYSHDPDMDVGP
jgi:hypothetical protein